MAIEAFAPAKVNLTLHVTGQRPDGYHLLDSLVAFADVGDTISLRPAPVLSLSVTGPRGAGVPCDDSNLVLRAARLTGATAEITLDKHLPAAAGIGGGSSDAAATLRAIAEMTGAETPENVLSLGADVPVCCRARVTRMGGIGEMLTEVPPLPPVWAVLVNPGAAVATPDVFRTLPKRDNAPMPAAIPGFADAPALAAWLARQRNDMQAPAIALAPEIGTCLASLAELPGCLLARMSGSGATCFGLFATLPDAQAAAQALSARHPQWWVQPTALS